MPNNKFYYYFNHHIGILCVKCALCLPHNIFSVSEMAVGTKIECVFHFGTKNGKIKKYEPK